MEKKGLNSVTDHLDFLALISKQDIKQNVVCLRSNKYAAATSEIRKSERRWIKVTTQTTSKLYRVEYILKEVLVQVQ